MKSPPRLRWFYCRSIASQDKGSILIQANTPAFKHATLIQAASRSEAQQQFTQHFVCSSNTKKHQLLSKTLPRSRFKIVCLPSLALGAHQQRVFWARWFERWHRLLKSGFDLQKSLTLIHQQSLTQQEAQLSFNALQALQQGQALCPVFQKSQISRLPVLPKQGLQIFSFAEQTGQLEQAFFHLHQHFSYQLAQRQKLKQALAYPIFIFCTAALLGLLLVFFILPSFAQFYADSGAPLPPLTHFLMHPAQYFSKQQAMGLTTLFAGVVVCVQVMQPVFLRHLKFRNFLNQFPFWKVWFETPKLQQEFYLLATALEQGMAFQQAITFVTESHPCPWRKRLWIQALKNLHAGQSACQVLQPFQLPVELNAQIEVAEQSGTLAESFQKIAAQLLEAIQQRQQRRLKWLPGMTMGFVSLMVGGLLLALYLPLFQLGGNIL